MCTAAEPRSTLFQSLEVARQQISARITAAFMATMGQCGFYGKGLINNSVYADRVLGTPEAPIERVPIDVLSHDTFEAACLQPLYAPHIMLLEASPLNYVSWHIREARWTLGELILAIYFFPNTFGCAMRWAQGVAQPGKFVNPTLRTPTQLDAVSGYLAHSALRQMACKPLLLAYILMCILGGHVFWHHPWPLASWWACPSL
jgi:hypothetical protein